MPNLTDEQIIDLYWSREESAITETDSSYGRYLRKISNNILKSLEDSDENVNDTYLKAWNAMPPERPTALSVYLGKLCRNSAIDRYRKNHAEKRAGSNYEECLDDFSEILAAPSTDSPSDAVNAMELMRTIDTFVRGLDPKKRAIFIGRYYYCDSISEISLYTQYTTMNVKTTLSRIRKDLAEVLRKEGYQV